LGYLDSTESDFNYEEGQTPRVYLRQDQRVGDSSMKPEASQPVVTREAKEWAAYLWQLGEPYHAYESEIKKLWAEAALSGVSHTEGPRGALALAFAFAYCKQQCGSGNLSIYHPEFFDRLNAAVAAQATATEANDAGKGREAV
jgi:hypothetical protein